MKGAVITLPHPYVTFTHNHIVSGYNRASQTFTSRDNVIPFGEYGQECTPLLAVVGDTFRDVALILMRDGSVWVGSPTYSTSNTNRLRMLQHSYKTSAQDGAILLKLLFERYPHLDKNPQYNPYFNPVPTMRAGIEYEERAEADHHANWVRECSSRIRSVLVKCRSRGMSHGIAKTAIGDLGLVNQVKIMGVSLAHHPRGGNPILMLVPQDGTLDNGL